MKNLVLFVVGSLVMWAAIVGAMWISSTEDYLPQEEIVEPQMNADELILYYILDYWGERLDATYNQADIENCPWEKGNWVDDVASEMDWQDVVNMYLITMPDWGTDDDVEMLEFIISNTK